MAENGSFEVPQETRAKRFGRVVGTFSVTDIPEGEAPFQIREEWLGVGLPVRSRLVQEFKGPINTYLNLISGHSTEHFHRVPIYGADAIEALTLANKLDAAQYWAENGYSLGILVFRAAEGELHLNQP